MTRLMILDSGAYGVWSKGAEIDLAEYIKFCQDYSDTSYYVALDVIPGKRGQNSLSKEEVEDACERGWQNYRNMIAELPRHKVIPVFHNRDDLKWLHKYLDFGVQYLGLGGIAQASLDVRMKFLGGLRRILFDGAGRPVVKLHGFGLTSFDVMRYWQWHSVDSTSWKLTAAWGGIYVPRKKAGAYDYSLDPLTFAVSPMSPSASQKQRHFSSMSPYVREQADEYLASEGMRLGEWIVETVPQGYSIPRGSEEFWYDKKKRQVLRTVVKGVATSFEERCEACWKFIKKANKVLPVKHIYGAGAPMPYPLEFRMGRRLHSYYDLMKDSGREIMSKHCTSIRSYKCPRQDSSTST